MKLGIFRERLIKTVYILKPIICFLDLLKAVVVFIAKAP